MDNIKRIPNEITCIFIEENKKMFETGKYEKIGYKLFMEYPDYRKKYESLSSPYQIGFLLGLIDEYRFSFGGSINNVLEIGVYNGVTSLYLLKQGCKKTSFELYGIDKGQDDFFGQAVFCEATTEEQAHYHLHKNSTSFDIEKVIGEKKIDMVFIDGGHSHPHPIIDLIHVIPFLHTESIVMLHDVVTYMRPNAWGESFIYCGWEGEKYRSVHLKENLDPGNDSSLGCIKIPFDKNKLYDNILNIVKLPFRVAPWKFDDINLGINENSINMLKIFMMKYYDTQFAEQISTLLYANLKEYKENWLLYLHETNFFNYLFEKSNKQQEILNDVKNKLNDLTFEEKNTITYRAKWINCVRNRTCFLLLCLSVWDVC